MLLWPDPCGVENISFIDKNFNKYKKVHQIIKIKNKKNSIYNDINDCDELKFDHIIDTTGDTEGARKGFNLMSKGSKLILVGQPKKIKH